MDVLGFRGNGVLLRLSEAGLQQRLDLLLTGPETVLRRQEAGSAPPTARMEPTTFEPWSHQFNPFLEESARLQTTGPARPGPATHRVTPDGLGQLLRHLLRHVAAPGQPALEPLHRRHHAAGRHHGRGTGDELDICGTHQGSRVKGHHSDGWLQRQVATRGRRHRGSGHIPRGGGLTCT